MLAKCYSGAVNGVDARTVEIEVYSAVGTSQFAIVGLPDTAVKEAKDRIPTALKNQGLASKKEFDVDIMNAIINALCYKYRICQKQMTFGLV